MARGPARTRRKNVSGRLGGGGPRKPPIKKKGSRWPPRSKPNCLFCGKIFPTYGAMVAHMNKHTKEKPYNCGQCDATFSFLAAKYVHRNSVHRGMTYECDQCSKVFTAPTNLANHKRMDHQRKTVKGRPRTDRVGKVAKGKRRWRRKLPVATKRRRKLLKEKCNNEEESMTETPKRSAALGPGLLLNLVKGLDRVVNQRREGISGELVVEEAVGEVKKDDGNENEGTEEISGLDSRDIVEEGCNEITDGRLAADFETGVDDNVGQNRLEPVEKVIGCTENLENGTKMEFSESDDNTSPTQDIGATSDKSFQTDDTEAEPGSVPIISSKLKREDDENPIPENLQHEEKVQLPANSEYPELVLVDPVTKAVTPFSSAPEFPPSSNRDGIPEHPPNLFFSVNGQVVMPMFSLTVLQHLTRRNSRLRSPSPGDGSEENEDEQPIKFQQPKRKTMKLSSRLKTAIVKGGDPIKPYKCHLCGSSFAGACHLATHLKSHRNTGSGSFSCSFCASSYNSRTAIQYHVFAQHSKSKISAKPFACPFCLESGKNLTFSEKLSFFRHLRVHFNQKRNKPRDSIKKPRLKGMTVPKSLPIPKPVLVKKKVAESILTSKGKHVCHVCNRGFEFPNKLAAHLNTHTGNRAWPCPLCGKRYYDRFQTAQHVAGAHSSVPPGQTGCSCPFCDGSFEEKRDISSHIIRNHRDRFQHMPEVSKQESDVLPSSVKTHPKSSARERNQQKTSALTNSVFVKKKVTQSIWKNKGKHVCHICNRGFKWSSKLVAHLNTHTGNRAWPCPLCDNRYYDRFQAARHVAGAHRSVSNGPSKYSCPFCTNGSFEERRDINSHIFRNHRDKFQNTPEVSKQEPEVLPSSVTTHSRPSAEKPSHQENSASAISNESVNKQKSKLSVELLKSKLKKIVRTRTSKKKMALKSKPITGMVPAENDSITPHTCPQCGSKFRLKCHLATHLKFHNFHNSLNQKQQSENTLSCQFCNCKYFIKSSLVRHIIARHTQQPDSNSQCPFCSYQGDVMDIKQRDKGLYKHIVEHLLQKAESPAMNPVNPIKNATSTQKAVLKNSSQKRVALPIRKQKQAVTASRNLAQPNRKLNKNLKKLVQKKPFSCKVCKLSFRYPSLLANHAMLHTEERPFGCSLCSLRFKRKDNLVAHIISIHCKRVEPAAPQKGLPGTSFFCCLCISPMKKFCGNRMSLQKHIFRNHKDELNRLQSKND